jgi:hypothetical protein
MELILVVAVLAALGVLALRFGVDSRQGFESPEHVLASRGVVRDDTPGIPARRDEPTILIAPVPAAGESYPTLRAIDVARGEGIPPLAKDPNAPRLESRARDLTDQYWSETAWLTGRVPHRSFETVAAALERDRAVPADKVTLLIMRETASATATIVN